MPLRFLEKRLNVTDHVGGRRIGVGLVVVFMLLTVLVAWLSLSNIKQHMLEEISSQLHTINNWTVQALDKQASGMGEWAAVLVRELEQASLIYAILEHQATPAQRFSLRRKIAETVFPLGYRDAVVLDTSGRVVFSLRRSEEGHMAPQGVLPFVHEALKGEAVLSHPFLRHGMVRMWLLYPIREKGKADGVLALELGAGKHFGVLSVQGRFGGSVETYLVDAEGRFLTPSRFETQLRRVGLLKAGESSVLNLKLRDPGRNLLQADGRQQAGSDISISDNWLPTFAMAHVLPKPDARMIHEQILAYRDYRGVPVVGVWQWDEALKLGVISEMDDAEALQSWRYIRNLIAVLLVGLLVVGLLVARGYARFRRRLEFRANEMRNLLMEYTAEAIYGVDINGCCSFINTVGVEMLGYDGSDELIGRNLHTIIHHTRADGTSYPESECGIFNCFRNKTRVHARDELFWRKDGTSFSVEYRAHPLFSDGGKIVGSVVTFLDITREKQAEEERARMEGHIQHTQRLESMGVLAGGIAHDFNNILAAILGNAELARMQMTDSSPDAKKNLNRIVQSCQRAAMLCRQMLAYSGKGKFVVKSINLTNQVESITHLLDVSLDKNVVIKYQLMENLPTVEADEAQIQQVIMNLVTNANEAIGGKSGVISISTGLVHADSDYLLDCYGDNPRPGRFVWVEVSDTGCGMDKATREKIFDPFFTTKFTGRGLGMSAVLGIVRGHKGALKLYSEVGRGTTFKFMLPMTQVKKDTPKVAVAGGERWQGSGLVLVVDDEEDVRETVRMLLENIGFDTITAGDGVEALAVYGKRQDAIVAVLMDLTMPRMSGEECFREMRRLNPDVRVVLTSGYNEQDAIQHFTGKHLAGFVQKPATMEKLRAAIRIALEGEDA